MTLFDKQVHMKIKSKIDQISINEQLVVCSESNGDSLRIECINSGINELDMKNTTVNVLCFLRIKENTSDIQKQIQKQTESEIQIYANKNGEIYCASVIGTKGITEFSCVEIRQTNRKYNLQDAQIRLMDYQKRLDNSCEEKQKIINEITGKINGIHSCIEWRIKNLTERYLLDVNNNEIKFRLQEIQEMNKELQLQRI